MTVEEMAKLGKWCETGNITFCATERCREVPANYARVRTRGIEYLWFFCDSCFKEYLRACDELREKARLNAA